MSDNLAGWTQVTLGEVASIEHGWPFKSEQFSAERAGRPIVVAIGNFRYDGGFRFEETSIKEYMGEYPTKYNLSAGDVLLVMTCQTEGGEILGIPGRIPNDGRRYLHNQRMGKVVVVAPDRADLSFLYQLFRWSEFNTELVASASGTKIVHTAPSRIEAFRFDLPPLSEQRAIANVLGALDDKIELNRQMNRTLEELASALFKSWFIDFEPVVAKAEGQRPFGMDAATAALFPSSLAGNVPVGWAARLLGTIMDGVKGRSYSSAQLSEHSQTALVSLKSFCRGGGYRRDGLKGYSGPYKPEQRVEPGEVIIALTDVTQQADVIGRAAIVAEDSHFAVLVASLDVMIARPIAKVPRLFLYWLLRSPAYVDHVLGFINGTTVLHLDTAGVQQFAFPMPSDEVLQAFHVRADAWFQLQANNENESRTLANLRDSLLPKLLSGEIRVKQAEQAVEKLL